MTQDTKAKILEKKSELQPYLTNIIEDINRGKFNKAYMNCYTFFTYLKTTFPDLHDMQEFNVAFNQVQVALDVNISNLEYWEAFMGALDDIKKEYADDENAKDKLTQIQAVMLGVTSCIACTIGADAYNNKSKEAMAKVSETEVGKSRFESRIKDAVQKIKKVNDIPQAVEWAVASPEILIETIERFVDELKKYQDSLPAEGKRSTTETQKYKAAESALSGINARLNDKEYHRYPHLENCKAIARILSTLDESNETAENTFTNIFVHIFRAIFGSSNRLGQKISDFKENLKQIKNLPSTIVNAGATVDINGDIQYKK